MKITQALKAWLTTNKQVAADATDEVFSKAVSAAIIDESLTPALLVDLTKDAQADAGSELMNRIGTLIDSKLSGFDTKLNQLEQKFGGTPSGGSLTATLEPFGGGKNAGPRLPEAFRKQIADSQPEEIRVKSVKEMYDTSRSELRFPAKTAKGGPHPFAGQIVKEGDRLVRENSQFDKALNGAYLKWTIFIENRCSNHGLPRSLQFNEHDKQLVEHALHECEWGGVIHGEGTDDEKTGSIGVRNRKLTPFEIKAVLDDSTSGGIEIAPIMFDDAIVQTPLLYGEFYPRVNTVTVTRGRRIEGGQIGNVTLTSGGADGTTISLFNTANFILAFDTTIFACTGAIELGLDFLSDSPIDVAGMVTEQYGRVLLAWLDEQVCIGDGTTEPEGVVNASGTQAVSATNGAGGPPTVGDYESLLFGVTKKYKQGYPTDRITYAGTETSYQRCRAIQVSTTDQRRVFGMTHEDYMVFNHPYGISEYLTNRQVLFVNWGRYRMYRRAGLGIRSSTEGKTLIRDNLMLITARARLGGQLEDGGAAAVQTNGQT